MSNCRNYDRVLVFVEDHSPVADPEPQAISPLKALHVAMPGLGKLSQPFVDPATNIG
jgi:hypothetical protein